MTPNANHKQPRIAIVYDWLNGIGGAERHVLEICRSYPEAPLFVSVYDRERTLDGFHEIDVRSSWIEKIPYFNKKHRLAFPFRYIHWIFVIRRQLKDYDIILSASGSEAKAIRPRKNQLIINTIFSPTHYMWSHFDEYLSKPGLGRLDPLVKILLPVVIWPLRKLDLYASRQPTHFLANSTAVAQRVQKYYKRKADVLYPPVNDLSVGKKELSRERTGLVVVGRQVPYKRIDLAVEAANVLNLPLKVIGNGPENQRLRELAGPTVEILGEIDEQEKIDILTRSQALIFPNEDDFGITPVEAMMAGCPVVAYRAGGALETVSDSNAGVYFDEQTPQAVAAAVSKLLGNPPNPQATRTWAMRFHKDVFHERLAEYVDQSWTDFVSREKTVLIDARVIASSTGTYMRELLNHLPSDQGFRYKALMSGKNFKLVNNDSVELIDFGHDSYGIKDQLIDQIKLPLLIRRSGCDLVHYTMPFKPLLSRKPSVITFHDFNRFDFPDGNPIKQAGFKFLIKRGLKSAKKIITPTDYVRNDILKRLPKIKSEKIVRTYEAADKITDPVEPISALEGKKFYLYVGNGKGHKNIRLLLETWSKHRNEIDADLAVVGGFEREDLADQGPLGQHIITPGWISEGQKRWAYENCQAFITASLSEGFGLPGLEAMANGAVTVSSDLTCLPEVYGPAAVYFDPHSADSLINALESLDTKTTKDMLVAGSKRAESYSWQRMADQTVDVYRSALDRI